MTPRRRSGRQATGSPLRNIGSLLLVFVVATLLYLYEQGTFDPWLQLDPAAQDAGGGEQVTTAPAAPLTEPQAPQAVETISLAGFAQGPVQVYFTRIRYPDRAAERAGGLDATIAADIDRARQSVDLAVFDLDLPVVVTALTNAQARGIRVRAVIDDENLETPEVAEMAGELQDAGIPITFDRRQAFMHNKFLVIDGAVVWTGSWNPTINDTFRNNNNFVRLADPRIAADYTAKFELLFAGRGGPGNRAALPHPVVDLDGFRVQVAFSPDSNITDEVAEVIAGARHSVEFLAFAFTSDPIAEAVIAAHERGVRVRGVMESRNAHGTGAEFDRLRSAGVVVLEDGNCYVMHHKVFVVDGRHVVTGSFNWSAQAQSSNDENVIIVDNAWFARRYQDEFERIYEQARAPDRCGG